MAPSDLTATAMSSSSISLAWTDNSDDEMSFIIERSLLPDSGFVFLDEVELNTESYVDTDLEPSTQYFYRVYADKTLGSSGYSNVASATTHTQ